MLTVGCGVPEEPAAQNGRVRADEANSDIFDEAVAEVADMDLPLPEVMLRWRDVDDAVAAFSSAESAATLEVRNLGDRALSVDLHAGGDAGTTVGTSYDAGTIEVAAGASETIEIDLTPYLQDSSYSSAVGVRGRLYDPSSGDLVGQVMSLPVYFHALEGGEVALYNDTVLRAAFGAGDFDGVAAADPNFVTPALDGEAPAITRIVAWAPSPGEEADLHQLHLREGLQQEESAANSDVGGGHDSITTPPNTTDYLHNLCVRINVTTFDSGNANSQGIIEDHWPNANDGIQVPALGMTVFINLAPFTTDRSTGCVAFTTTSHIFTATVTAYAQFTSSNGSYVRLHDGPSNSEASHPGSTYAYSVADVEFYSSFPAYVDVAPATESGERRWSGAAAFMKSLMRYDDGLPANTEIHVSPNGSCTTGNQNYANDVVNNESYIRMEGSSCFGSDLQSKFNVAHEYGHALGSQHANLAGVSPSGDDHNASPFGSCSFVGTGSNYGTDSKEWSSISVREGWAHFVSGRVWNDKDTSGTLRWENTNNLDRWNTNNLVRGLLKNDCCPGNPGMGCQASLDGAGTIGDWMRAFWDLHTQSCAGAPDKLGMTDLYSEIVNSAGLANDNFWTKSVTAVGNLFPSCETDWELIGCHNGTDQQGGANQYGACP
jgi:hypothetical protein